MRTSWLFAACFLVSSGALAMDDPTIAIKATLTERFPDVQIESVGPSPWAGMYEVVTATEIVYTNIDGSLLMSGNLLDTKTRENITTVRWNALHAIDFARLPFDRAIKIVKGDGSRKLAIFSDPECPYCQQLEQSLREISNVTLYVFLYPLQEVHPTARDKALKIWCARDQQATWSTWMLDRKEPPAAACSGDPIDELQELGQHLKVQSTPTLFFADGHRLPGAAPAQRLEEELKIAAQKVARR